MTRAARVCGSPGCPHLEPCPDHERKPWEGSRRRERTVSGWKQQARAKRILRRDEYRCHVCGLLGADQVDHKIPLAEGGADTEENLGAIHSEPCHREKTAAEARRART